MSPPRFHLSLPRPAVLPSALGFIPIASRYSSPTADGYSYSSPSFGEGNIIMTPRTPPAVRRIQELFALPARPQRSSSPVAGAEELHTGKTDAVDEYSERRLGWSPTIAPSYFGSPANWVYRSPSSEVLQHSDSIKWLEFHVESHARALQAALEKVVEERMRTEQAADFRRWGEATSGCRGCKVELYTKQSWVVNGTSRRLVDLSIDMIGGRDRWTVEPPEYTCARHLEDLSWVDLAQRD